MSQALQIEVRDSLEHIDSGQWNALCDDGNPFVCHEFLYSLEACDCVGEHNGWYPRYFLLWKGDAGKDLVGAVASYVKTNSYGEFVFDWSWADAFERHGLQYYPKLVASIPFTPATGRRLLVRKDQPHDETVLVLAEALRQFCDSQQYSSLHWLFLTPVEAKLLYAAGEDEIIMVDSDADADGDAEGDADEDGDTDKDETPEGRSTTLPRFLKRMDCQYHWHNHGYQDFDDFLANCTSKRRKTIRRERRHVSDAKLRVEQRLGSTLGDDEWRRVHHFYSSTFDRKWGNPSLTLEFFKRVGQVMGDRVLIVFAYNLANESPATPIACSVMFIGENTLYGRYWGCSEQHNSLHFEACYYQGIDYCIRHGIDNFEPGAQGEHKITRGFEPTITHSAHYIAHPGFRDAIAQFLNQETRHVEQRCSGLTNLLPFRKDIVLQ